ncbi:MAG: dihydroorotate dehydrogenase electron transfer subunit [Candidatus Omnitrophota bacterium]
MFQIKAKLLYNKRVRENYFHCALEAPRIALKASPGQFVNVRVVDSVEPLLRRPFGIHRVQGKAIEILYEVLGKGTEILSLKKAGEYLDVIGPLGNGFNYELRTPPLNLTAQGGGSEEFILVAGGMGVAPLIFLAEKLRSAQSSKFKVQSMVLIGAKTKNQILCEKEFKQLGFTVLVSTDDGSKGFKGKVTGLLKRQLRTMDYELRTIFACGPRPMLKEVVLFSRQKRIPAQVSLEEHMACGMGACLGCVVNTRVGFKRVCKEGPVFKAEEIIWK